MALAKRSRVAQLRKREQARDHLQEAQVRGAQADKEQALADEQAARARRERAEVEERVALAEQAARERSAHADEERAAADELRAKAEKLAPGVADDGASTQRVDDTVPDRAGHLSRPARRYPSDGATAAEFRPGRSSLREDGRRRAAGSRSCRTAALRSPPRRAVDLGGAS